MKRHIPNFITLCNLMAGTAALLLVMSDEPAIAVILLLVAAVCDFLDGTAARLLNATSPIGKQLDSLADIVSFGVAPAAMIYKIMMMQLNMVQENTIWNSELLRWILILSIFIVPVFSAIRLARFNLQEEGRSTFLGLPTPAHALFWTGIYYDMLVNGSLYGKDISLLFTWAIVLLLATMMLLPLPMLSLKFRSFRLRENIYACILVGLGIALLVLLQVPGLSVLILVYILLSLVRIVLT